MVVPCSSSYPSFTVYLECKIFVLPVGMRRRTCLLTIRRLSWNYPFSHYSAELATQPLMVYQWADRSNLQQTNHTRLILGTPEMAQIQTYKHRLSGRASP